ncbi:uncharacterized protein LOC143234980 isoform X2 [Tachypleus tridentatus]|uniref:uncharacterized protein LOC143234980 isoform X2 n=1 Tax=Tachypleus tridentatus TaxID=6853 RepID=UPI003FD6ABED
MKPSTLIATTGQTEIEKEEVNAYIQTRSGRLLRMRSARSRLQERRHQKRQVLQDMSRPLKQWLIRHRDNPYPSKAEKISLALGSQMTLVQVSNWFANARRRLKNTVRSPGLSWKQRIRLYNSYASGNAESFSISSDDSIWDSDSDLNHEDGKTKDLLTNEQFYYKHEEHSYSAAVPRLSSSLTNVESGDHKNMRKRCHSAEKIVEATNKKRRQNDYEDSISSSSSSSNVIITIGKIKYPSMYFTKDEGHDFQTINEDQSVFFKCNNINERESGPLEKTLSDGTCPTYKENFMCTTTNANFPGKTTLEVTSQDDLQDTSRTNEVSEEVSLLNSTNNGYNQGGLFCHKEKNICNFSIFGNSTEESSCLSDVLITHKKMSDLGFEPSDIDRFQPNSKNHSPRYSNDASAKDKSRIRPYKRGNIVEKQITSSFSDEYGLTENQRPAWTNLLKQDMVNIENDDWYLENNTGYISNHAKYKTTILKRYLKDARSFAWETEEQDNQYELIESSHHNEIDEDISSHYLSTVDKSTSASRSTQNVGIHRKRKQIVSDSEDALSDSLRLIDSQDPLSCSLRLKKKLKRESERSIKCRELDAAEALTTLARGSDSTESNQPSSDDKR